MLTHLYDTIIDVASGNPLWYTSLFQLWRQREPAIHNGWRTIRLAALTALGLATLVALTAASGRLFSQFLEVGLLSVLALMLGADALHILISVGKMRQHFHDEQWDMLRATTIEGQTMLDAYYASLQVQVWYVMIAEIAARIALGMLALSAALVGVGQATGRTVPVICLPIYVASPMFMIVFVVVVSLLETWWRMRAVVAVGMWLSMRIKRRLPAVLVGMAVILAIRIAQLTVCLPLIALVQSNSRSAQGSDFLMPMYAAVIGSVIYFGLRALRKSALRASAKRILAAESE